MSSQNAGTNSPKNEQADPMGSSTTEGQQGKTSQGASGEQQRGSGTSLVLLCLTSCVNDIVCCYFPCYFVSCRSCGHLSYVGRAESSMDKKETGPSDAAISVSRPFPSMQLTL